MSSGFALSVDSDLARRLDKVDEEWLTEQLEEFLLSACEEYEGRRGGEELAAYDSQEELEQDSTLSEAKRKQLLIKWWIEIGGARRWSTNMRTNEVRLSHSEKQRLQEYRNRQFDQQIPFGYVIGHLLEEATE